MLATQPSSTTSADSLPPRRRAFVQHYLTDLNGRAAAIRAGYGATGAHVTASRLLSNREVKAAIAETLAEKHDVSRETIVQELATIAFVDLSEFCDWDSNGIKLRAMPTNGATKAVAAVRHSTGGIAEVRMHDKLKALELLAKVLGLIGRGR